MFIGAVSVIFVVDAIICHISSINLRVLTIFGTFHQNPIDHLANLTWFINQYAVKQGKVLYSLNVNVYFSLLKPTELLCKLKTNHYKLQIWFFGSIYLILTCSK